MAVDLDNTLTDRAAVFERWIADFFRTHGITDDDAAAELTRLDADGFGDKRRMFEAVRNRWCLDAPVDELIDAFQTGMIERTELPASSRGGLGRLVAGGFAVLVVTNGSPRQQEKIDRLSLRDLVHGVAVSSIVGVRKPEPGIIEAAGNDAGLELRQVAWMIGDSAQADIRGGEAIGARTIWLSRGRPWPLTDLHPFATVTSFIAGVDLVVAHGAREANG